MRVLITPRSFAKSGKAALELLAQKGLTPVINPAGTIMDEDCLRGHISGCSGVIVGVDPLTAHVMSAAPELRAVAKYGVGVDNIDLQYCEEHGIKVSRALGANSAAVADYTMALMLALARRLPEIDRRCRRKDWSRIMSSDVTGKRLGLIGLGAVGHEVARRAAGFSMEVWAHDPAWDADYAAAAGIRRAGVDDICRECDFISLHAPLLPETQKIVGAAQIAMMKPTAYLINTARGGLVDEEALARALEQKAIAGAGIDVFTHEPPDDESLYALDNLIMGSHCAASTDGAADAMSLISAQNLIRDLGLQE